MSQTPGTTPKIIQLAALLETDIQNKGLEPGDPYLSAHEAAKMLGVSTGSANRALQLLVKRDVISRRQRLGTFVAHPSEQPAAKSIDCVQMLTHQNFLRSEGLLADGVVLGIQEELPRADIRFNFLPGSDDGSFTNRLVTEVLRSTRVQGFVLVRAPLEVQRIIQASGLPAVIYGTPFPSITSIPWIDRDQYSAGRLAAARLLRQGLTKITVVSRDRLLPGDYGMLDGVRDEMHAARLPISALTLRPLPADPDAVEHAIKNLIKDDTVGRGFICRSRPLADGAAAAITSLGLRLGAEADVVLLDVYRFSTREAPPYPYLFPVMNPEMTGRRLGHMLIQQSLGLKPNPENEIIAVELREPSPNEAPAR